MKRILSTLLTAFLVSSLAHHAFAAPGAIYSAGAPTFGSTHEPSTQATERVSKDGAAGWAVPFEVPPGRAGAQPTVALTYSSRGPTRGGIAAGWALTTSKIEVDTTQGRAQAVNYSINGTRLVRVTDSSVGAGVEAYRAQDDMSFTRYERIADASEAGRWVARTLDGMTLYFGSTDASRDTRFDGVAGDRTYGGKGRWFLDATVDAANNRVSYYYTKAFGRAKHTAAVVAVDVNLSTIEYGANDSVAGSGPHARVDFDWAGLEYCPGSLVPIGAQFTFRNGVRTYDGARRLRSIQSWVRSTPGGAWSKRRELALNYDSNAASCTQLHGPLRVLTSVQEAVTSPEGLVTTLPAQTFEYGPLFPDFSAVAPAFFEPPLSGGKNPHNPNKPGGWPSLDVLPIDLNGDGQRETLTTCEGLPRMPWAAEPTTGGPNPSTQLNFREGCSPTAQVTHRSIDRGLYDCQGVGTTFFGYRFFDVTGDGLPDLVAAMNYQKGDYIAEDDTYLKQLYPQAYPACSSLPAPACTFGDSTRTACWLNKQTQFVARPGGPSFYSAPTAGGSGGGGTGGGGGNSPPVCPTGTCVLYAGCVGTEGDCCNASTCAQDGHGPATDPPSVVEGNQFSGPEPTSEERQAQPQAGSPSCAFIPDMHCGQYVWWVYPNKGALTQGTWFETQPRIVFSPIPLESDNLNTNSGAGSLASASNYRATGDLDGDGFPDAIYQVPEHVMSTLDLPQYDFRVWWGKGDGAFQQTNNGLGVLWETADRTRGRPRIDASVSNLGSANTVTKKQSMLFDFNGDGLLDYVVGTNLYFNTGTGFEPSPTSVSVGTAFDTLQQTNRVAVTPSSNGVQEAFSLSTARLVDLDLDGLDDLVVMGPPNTWNPFVSPSGSTLRAFLNVGDGFSELASTEAWRLVLWRHALQGISIEHNQEWHQRTDLVDLNGDGLPDLTSVEDYSRCPTGPVAPGQYVDLSLCGLDTQVRYAPSTPLRVLTAVNSGAGARVEFRYASTNDPQVVGRAAGSRLTSPLWVVKQLIATSGTAGEPAQVTDYRYENPTSNRDEFGRFGFRGFARTVTTGPTPATGRRLRTIHEWAFDQNPSGLLKRTLEGEVWSLHDGREELIRMSEHQWRSLGLFYPQFFIGTPQPALTNWGQSEVKNTTCRTPLVGLLASAEACVAGGLWSRQLSTWTALLGPVPGRGIEPVIGYRVSHTRRTTTGSATPQPEDRLTATGVEFRANAGELRLLTTSEETASGAGLVLARREATYETTRRAALTEERRFLDATTIARTRRSYDGFGNVTLLTRPNQVAALLAGQTSRAINYTYDAFGLYRASESNELGHVTRATFDPGTGKATLKEGISQGGLVPRERTKFDGLGRPLEVRRTVLVGATFNEQLVSRFTYFDTAPRRVVEEHLKSGTEWILSTTTLDGLGRATRVEAPAGALTEVMRRQFDGAGNPIAVFKSSPTGTGEALFWTQFDAFGRPTRVKNDGSAQVQTIYTGPYTTIYEWPLDGGPLSYRLIEADALGRPTAVFEGYPSMSVTRYLYDPLDRVTRVTDADGVVSNITYDRAGRRTLVERAGNKVESRFDFHGNRTTALFPTASGVADPVRYAAYWTFDALDRVTTITPMARDLTAALQAQLDWNPAGPQSASFTLIYDVGVKAMGRLGSVKAPWGTTSYGYTMEGWLANETRSIAVRPDGVTQFTHLGTQSWTYDLLGNVTATTHPDGYNTTASFSSDPRGRPLAATLQGVTPLEVARFDRNASGVVTRRTTPTAGSSQTWTYDPMGRVFETRVQGQWCDTACTAGTIAGEQFSYFETGHPRSMTDLAKGRTFDFLYNDHLELRDARTRGTTEYVGAFTFAPTGRVLTANVSSTIPGADVVSRNTTSSYAPWNASDRADPGAVRALRRADGSSLATMTYDVAGNLTRKVDGTTTLDFATDARDSVREVKDQLGRRELYWYDHLGQRVLVYRSAPASGGAAEVVHRFRNTEVTMKASGQRTSTVDVVLGASPVARVANGNTMAPELLFHGALRSLLAVQNVSGTVTARFGYGPWGELLYQEGNSSQRYDRRYEGKAADAFSKLSYFGFRYYDSLTMAWTQGDPLYRRFPDAAGTDPRRMSPYVSVLNDPLTLIDPDGLEPFDAAWVSEVANSAVSEARSIDAARASPGGRTLDGRVTGGRTANGIPFLMERCTNGPAQAITENDLRPAQPSIREYSLLDEPRRVDAAISHYQSEMQIGFMTKDAPRQQTAAEDLAQLLLILIDMYNEDAGAREKGGETHRSVREGQEAVRRTRERPPHIRPRPPPVPMPTPDRPPARR